jgi:hypothetical protein
MNKIAKSIGLIVILFFVGCSNDNSTNSKGDDFNIIGTWSCYDEGYENRKLVFYDNDAFVLNGMVGTYSYLKFEKKGSLFFNSNPNNGYEFWIEDDVLVVNIIIKFHYKK